MVISTARGDARAIRSELHEQDRLWRMGYEAGLKRRRLVELGILGAALVFLRKRLHPFVALLVVLMVALVLWPLLYLVLAVQSTCRDHRRWRNWRRTGLLAGSWLLGAAIILAVLAGWPLLLLISLPVAFATWSVERRLRTLRALRYVGPPEPPFTDADRVPGLPTPAEHHREVGRRCRSGT
jgi:hypothetical protein